MTVSVTSPADGVWQVTLQRPRVLNALDEAMITGLHEAITTLAANEQCRVVILSGQGRGFCAGLDVGYYAQRLEALENRTPQRRMALQQSIASLVLRLRELPQPVIAAVNGPAAGGGMGLALACDLRLAAASASFVTAFINLGLGGTDIGVSWLLPRIVGTSRAFELMLTGRAVPAAEALEIGLVTRVVPDAALLDAAVGLAGEIAAKSPMGVRLTKEVMWSQLEVSSLRAGLDLENRSQVLTTVTADHDEAIAAFRARRPPRYRNT